MKITIYQELIDYLNQNDYKYVIQIEKIEKVYKGLKTIEWYRKIIKIDNEHKSLILKDKNIFSINSTNGEFIVNIFEFENENSSPILKGELRFNGNFIQTIKVKPIDLLFLNLNEKGLN